jgi:hypothetical protein
VNKNEERLELLLERAGIPFERQGKAGGHRIDCLVGNVAVGINGEWWHAKPKIIECDRVKLPRVVRAGVIPLGLWDSRAWKYPESVVRFVREALDGHLAVWDWNVPITELPEDVRDQVAKWMGKEVRCSSSSRS